MANKKKRVLFICIGNMVRSQMAEGLARELGGDYLEAYSAGLAHTGSISDKACKVMKERGIDISGQYSKGVEDVAVDKMDYVVSLTDRPAAEVCAPFHEGVKLDWNINDPYGGPVEAFRFIRDELEDRIRRLVEEICKASRTP
jgi:arsenate reductase